MKRLIAIVILICCLSVACLAFETVEAGFSISVDRLRALLAPDGRWAASVDAYMLTALDDVWRMETRLGFDFAHMAPSATIGFRDQVSESFLLEADVTLQWRPRHGIIAWIDTGIRYHPLITERSRLILETFPIRWQIISVDHRYFPIPELRLAGTFGAMLLLEQGGFVGEAITVQGYKIEHRRLPFSLFVGNEWYLTVADFATRIGYQW